jgi:hypothetical protein
VIRECHRGGHLFEVAKPNAAARASGQRGTAAVHTVNSGSAICSDRAISLPDLPCAHAATRGNRLLLDDSSDDRMIRELKGGSSLAKKELTLETTVLRTLLCLILVVHVGIANATPVPARESVMASAMRCSVIADSHQWLDCFYGSAQQVRQSLKLAPAPDNQLQLTQNPPAGGTVYDAEMRVSILSAALNCGNLIDDRQWLNCYYGSGDAMRVSLGLKPLSPGIPALVLPPQPNAADGLAMPNQPFGPANRPTRFPLRSQIKSYSFSQMGMFTMVLDNGQVWRQLSGDTNYVGHLSTNEVVTISRGAFGSYNMRVDRRPEYFKVRRAL